MKVYNELGPGLKESIYGNAFEELLKQEEIFYQREPNMPVEFEGKKVGDYRPDFLVYNKIIVELKSVPQIPRTQIQRVYQYLKSSKYKLGFIINFGAPKLQIIRRIFDLNKSVKSVINPFNLRSEAGQSLIEVLVALAVFTLGIATIGFLALDANVSSRQGVERTQATLLSKEGLEAARSIRDADFDNLTAGTHGIVLSGNKWIFSGTSDIQDQFIRSITIEDISAKEKKITSNISWQFSQQRPNSVSLVTYLTDWLSAVSPSSCNEYAIQEGYSAGTCRQNPQQCTNNGETYLLGGDIYCTGGPSEGTCCGLPLGGGFCSGTAMACAAFGTSPTCLAQAGCSWGGGASGATTNPSFDFDSAGWTYADWETSNKVDGDRQSSGGNPNGYIRVVVSGQKNQTISGYWTQSFITTADNPTGVVGFDWRVPSYVSTGLTSYYLYIFVENVSGAPTLANYVWRSPLITGTTNWATISNLDISSKLGAAGTYYLKTVARGIYNNTNGPGTTIGAFDNVQLNWSKADSCSGTATVCDTFTDQLTCQAQEGCLWNQ